MSACGKQGTANGPGPLGDVQEGWGGTVVRRAGRELLGRTLAWATRALMHLCYVHVFFMTVFPSHSTCFPSSPSCFPHELHPPSSPTVRPFWRMPALQRCPCFLPLFPRISLSGPPPWPAYLPTRMSKYCPPAGLPTACPPLRPLVRLPARSPGCPPPLHACLPTLSFAGFVDPESAS